MRQPRYFQPNSYYHILLRGNNQDIFLGQWDYSKFIAGLDKYSKKFSITILVFALMPNHVHLLLRQDSELPVSKFMQVLTTSYVVYFNLKNHRKGHLLENRFKHIEITTDDYLVHLSRYIHLNPSSSKIVSRPEEYNWTSYRHYLGSNTLKFVDKETILNYFSSK